MDFGYIISGNCNKINVGNKMNYYTITCKDFIETFVEYINVMIFYRYNLIVKIEEI